MPINDDEINKKLDKYFSMTEKAITLVKIPDNSDSEQRKSAHDNAEMSTTAGGQTTAVQWRNPR